MTSDSCDVTAQGAAERLADIDNFKMAASLSLDFKVMANEMQNVSSKGFEALRKYCLKLKPIIGNCVWKEDFDKLKSIFSHYNICHTISQSMSL